MAELDNPWYNMSSNVTCHGYDSYQDKIYVQVILSLLYSLVFVVAVFGNSLVVYVVATNKDMQSVTNIFITNLAVADLLVNATSLWLTPCYTFLGRWVWGSAMCHAVPLFQGMSTFISALTLTAIAMDRYMVILYPFRPRMSIQCCIVIVLGIWILAFVLVAPLVVHMNLYYHQPCGQYICREEWSSYPDMRFVYGFVVLSLQFGVPFLLIAYCYVRIWVRIVYRKSMLNEMRNSLSSNADEQRKKRLLKMMVCMVVIFGLCWLPVNTLNVLNDAATVDMEEYYVIVFLCAHLCSMSATCWNPILYAWMNENFRREFKAVLPCFRTNERLRRLSSTHRGHRQAPATAPFEMSAAFGSSSERKAKLENSPFLFQRASEPAFDLSVNSNFTNHLDSMAKDRDHIRFSNQSIRTSDDFSWPMKRTSISNEEHCNSPCTALLALHREHAIKRSSFVHNDFHGSL